MSIYTGTFFIALATLSFEVCLTRLLSVITWYSLAFFAISTAMAGMTAGSVRVYLRSSLYRGESLLPALSRSSLLFSFSSLLALILLCELPLTIDPAVGIMGLLGLLTATTAIVFPFYFSGVCIAAALTRSDRPVPRVYACDLLGASLGCLTALFVLNWIDTPSCIILSGAFGALAALCYGMGSPLKKTSKALSCSSVTAFIALMLLTWLNTSPSMIRPLFTKGKLMLPSNLHLDIWNSISRVTVYPSFVKPAFFWGQSPVAQAPEVKQVALSIDGKAGTIITEHQDKSSLEYLRYDLTNLAYWLRPTGGACVIGVGGGRDVMSALAFGHESITGVEINPAFVNLLKGEFREMANIADQAGVELVVDEARSWLSRTDKRFRVIQMSMIDTWAATTAGAYALSENNLYTTEAWKTFLSRLTNDGIFTVSRWYDPEFLGETGRMISLAVAALLDSGATEPSRHIAVITTRPNLATLILSRAPLTEDEISLLKERVSSLHFMSLVMPGVIPDDPLLASILGSKTRQELEVAIAEAPLDFSPPTDDTPYFFNMLKVSHARTFLNRYPETIRGNLLANLTLILLMVCLGVLVLLTILVPLVVMRWRNTRERATSRIHPGSAVYFSLIGSGFMLVEIALLQRTSTLLGHPILALGVSLFTLILSTGAGSLLSAALPVHKRVAILALPVLAGIIIILAGILLNEMGTILSDAEPGVRIVGCVLILCPLGMVLGLFYPTGMRVIQGAEDSETPWYWALNGICGVFSSSLAVFLSIQWGISVTLWLGAFCYLLLMSVIPGMAKSSQRSITPRI